MIPKVIHYCWFGGNPLPELTKECIKSWKMYCPDYEIKEWNEYNFNINCCDFVKEAYEAKKWSFVSDYARLYIIYHEGGVYLDTDVELIQNIDSFLENKCFLGEEKSGFVNTGIGFGAEKNNMIVKEMLDEYDGKHFKLNDKVLDTTPCPQKNTAPLLKYGYKYSGTDIWKDKNVTVYPPEFFSPMDYETGRIEITDNTKSIHHYTASWHSKTENQIQKITRFCFSCFGRKYGGKLARVIDIPLRIKYKIESAGIKATVKLAISKVFNSENTRE